MVAILVVAGNAGASIGFDDFLLTGSVMYTTSTLKDTGEQIDGAGFGLTIEQLGSQDPVSFGISFAYYSMYAENNEAGLVTKATVNSYPIYLMGRYWFGKGALQTYIGGAFGVYFSERSLTTVTDQTHTSFGMSGTGLSVPLGIALSVTEKVYITAGYSFNWLIDNDFLEDGIVHAVGFGLGINFGN